MQLTKPGEGGPRGTHHGRWFPSGHDADQREVLGLVTVEGGWRLCSHHFDGGRRSCQKGSTKAKRLSWKVQEESTAYLRGARPHAECWAGVGAHVAPPEAATVMDRSENVAPAGSREALPHGAHSLVDKSLSHGVTSFM